MAKDIHDQLTTYLKDAYAMEQQSLTMLEAAERMAGDPDVDQTYRGHVTETEEHVTMVGKRLEELGESPSKLKDLAGRAGALGLGGAVAATPDTPGKLAAAAYGYENFEIASYELLRRVAERAHDTQTVQIADRILAQERSAVEKISWGFDAVVDASLQKTGAAS